MILVRKEKFDSAFGAEISNYGSDLRIIREVDTVEDGLSLASDFLLSESYTGRIQIVDYTPCTPVWPAKSTLLYTLYLNGTAVVKEMGEGGCHE